MKEPNAETTREKEAGRTLRSNARSKTRDENEGQRKPDERTNHFAACRAEKTKPNRFTS